MSPQQNQIRIIAGQWRGRKLSFPDAAGLRPTTDRIRETVFNWLMPVLPGAHCLDLFAGSGALGFEAASRGAERVVMVENHPQVFKSLEDNCTRLSAENIVAHRNEAKQFLTTNPEPFDIVFLDPPFQLKIITEICQLLETGGWLKPGALIYRESPKADATKQLPWQQIKSKAAGQVSYALYQANNPA